jgi:hypothetical protein
MTRAFCVSVAVVYGDAMAFIGSHPPQGMTVQYGYTNPPHTNNIEYKRRNPQSFYWRAMSEERRAIEREKSRLRMQISRARRKERERLRVETATRNANIP